MADEGLIFWDDCDAALLGLGGRCGFPDVAVYDWRKLVRVFQKQGMTEEEAIDWIEFNIAGAYVGPQTPILLHRMTRAEIEDTCG